MNKILQWSLLLASSATLIFILRQTFRNKMNIHYAMAWIIWAALMVFISLFPRTVIRLSHLMGISVPSNAIFLIAIFLLYVLNFYAYMKISKQNEDILKLNFEIAYLKKQMEEKERGHD